MVSDIYPPITPFIFISLFEVFMLCNLPNQQHLVCSKLFPWGSQYHLTQVANSLAEGKKLDSFVSLCSPNVGKCSVKSGAPYYSLFEPWTTLLLCCFLVTCILLKVAAAVPLCYKIWLALPSVQKFFPSVSFLPFSPPHRWLVPFPWFDPLDEMINPIFLFYFLLSSSQPSSFPSHRWGFISAAGRHHPPSTSLSTNPASLGGGRRECKWRLDTPSLWNLCTWTPPGGEILF